MPLSSGSNGAIAIDQNLPQWYGTPMRCSSRATGTIWLRILSGPLIIALLSFMSDRAPHRLCHHGLSRGGLHVHRPVTQREFDLPT